MKDLIAKCPKKLWIGTAEFSLQFVPPGDPMLKEDGDELNGCCVFDPPTVYIAETLSLTKSLEILMHELTHAIAYEYEIEDGADEEEICKQHGKAWSTFWITNPRFGRWWLSACVAARKARTQ